MEALRRLNDCITYIEGNLEGEIGVEELAKLAFTSKYQFQRTFTMLTGYSVAEYVRKRRLTLAAQELMSPNVKVIDVALRYGYETPESFSKAFRKAHGVSPSQVKKTGKALKAFPRISFHIQLKGEMEMNYRIVEKDAFQVIGVSKVVSTVNGENHQVIPTFWDEVNESGVDEKIAKLAGNQEYVGVCMDFDHPNERFTYFIGAEDLANVTQSELEKREIPRNTWAVFESVGPMPHAIQAVWQRIYSEWFPSTGYKHAGGPEFELYLPGDVTQEDYRCEVWIPIMKN
ncbi:AraC family transcriptional regulator [Bacillus coahuilensis]|nr:AraC family transcriptional regulator [Bacillus coahuilensis]